MGDIFLKFFNISITACWLILAVLCVRLLFRKIPKWLNCLLWGVVAIRLIFPFSIESVFSLQPSAQLIQSSAVVGGEVMPYVPSVDSDLAFVENTINPMLAETFAYQASESAAPLQVITGIAGIIWICGMAIMLLFALGSMLRLYFQVREAVRYNDNVFICDAVKSPFILGIVRPKVYLPSSLNENEIPCIIAHEQAHLRRKDHLWKPFGYLLLSIYWFNPLCWVAYVCLCKDIELACDEKVIRDMSFADKKEYSRVLLSCATQKQLVFACPLAFGEVGVKERVKTVLNYKKPAFWITFAAIAVCAVLAVCFLTNPAEENAKPDNSVYGSVVAGLGDDETYAFLAMDYDCHVLLTTDLIYDEGSEPQAAVYCDVYYCVDEKAQKLGSVMSDGTAYPITFTNAGIYAASGHSIEKYVISEERVLSLEKGVYEQFDETGNAKYICMEGGQESEITEEEYLELQNEYGRSQIVHFSYGANGSVNEYQNTEEINDVNYSEAFLGEIDVPENVLEIAREVVLERYYQMQENGAKQCELRSLEHVYTYDDLEGKNVEIYQMYYAFLMEDPDNVTLAGGMTMDEEGWVVPEYPGSTYLCLAIEEAELSYVVLTENDCFPGDEVFTEDLVNVISEEKKVEALVLDFSKAYFEADTEGMRKFLSASFEGDLEIYNGSKEDVQINAVKGLTEVTACEVGDTCDISVEFKESANTDYYVYLTVTLEKETDGWKVSFYGLEG